MSPPSGARLGRSLGFPPAETAVTAVRSRSVGYTLRRSRKVRGEQRHKTIHLVLSSEGGSSHVTAMVGGIAACGATLAAGLAAGRTNTRRPTTRRRPTIVLFDESCARGDSSTLRAASTISSGRSESQENQLPTSPNSASAPSRGELGRLFYALDQGTGRLGPHEIRQAAIELSDKYSLGLAESDTDRLVQFLQGYEPEYVDEKDCVHRDAFVNGFRGLGIVLARLTKHNLTAYQMRTVVGAAFKHFDLNNDGVISQEELRTATSELGVQMSDQDVKILHRFIAPSCNTPLQKDDVPIWEKISSAFQATLQQTQKRYSVESVDTLIARMSKAPQMPNTWEQQFCWVQQHVCEVAEHWASALELAVSAAGMGVAAQYAADCLDGVNALAEADWHRAAPFLTFLALGVMDFARELDEMALKEMTVDEALLYAVVLREKGFSQVQFRQLLACKGCRWTIYQAGDVLNKPDDRVLSFMVRGRAQATDDASKEGAVVRPGTVIGAAKFLRDDASSEPFTLFAEDRVVCVSWDHDELRSLLAHHDELAVCMDKVLAGGLSNKLRIKKELKAKQAAAARPMRKAFKFAEVPETPEEELSEEDTGIEAKKTNSATRRSEEFLEEVRWLRLHLLMLRRHASSTGMRTHAKPIMDVALNWLDTMSKEMINDVQRRGVLRTWYGVQQVVDALKAPKSTFQDVCGQAFNFWHSLDDAVNINNVLSDYSGAFLLVYGAWHHMCAQNGCLTDDFDAKQFMMLMGIWGVRTTGHAFRKTAEDLPAEEAVLYAKGGFEEAGFTAGEFRHLLHAGAAKCEKLQLGEVKVVGLSGPTLHMVIEGTARVAGNSYAPGTTLSAREFLGQDALGVQDPLLACPRMQCRLEATDEETTILAWDVAQLQAELARDSKLRMKMLRMVTLSMADRLLRDTMASEVEVAHQSALAA
eukprot:CAMPEP_0195104570 /NCGR_PEP_ID=MMETSP0448-20130528/73170_1 /TAXON_ID=66468 /ORGANISM="Heterocapsa triquestra, Strain CCMP 448" /LENGTH=929 /DNA_ID=CAMNT_0040140425 /DNA_START=113 /DNA_END=2902 /DNA_ORIENTATION=-